MAIDPDKIKMGDKYAQANRGLIAGIAGAFPNTVNAVKGAGNNIADAYQKGGIPAAAGATVRNTMVPALGLADDVMTGAKIALDPAANALKTAVTGDPVPISGTPRPAAPQPQGIAALRTPVMQGGSADRQAGNMGQAAAPSIDPQQSYDALRNDMGQGIARRAGANPSLVATGNAGLRELASNPGLVSRMNQQYQTDNLGVQASKDANGRMVFSDAPMDPNRPTVTRGISSGGDMGAVNESMARTNAIRQSMIDSQANWRSGPGGGVIGSGADDTTQRWALEKAATERVGQAQGMLGGQRKLLQDLYEGPKERAIKEQQNAIQAQGNDISLQRIAADQGLGIARLASDQQRDQRAGALYDTQREGELLDVAQKKQVVDLRNKLAGAKPEERQSLIQQLNDLQGGDSQRARDRYIPVQGGQVVGPDGITLMTAPSRIFDAETQRYVDGQGTPQDGRGGSVAPSDNHIAVLQQNAGNKEAVAAFERRFGKGSAAQYLQQ